MPVPTRKAPSFHIHLLPSTKCGPTPVPHVQHEVEQGKHSEALS